MKEFDKLDKGNIEDIIALTPTQQGILFHYLKDPESDLYFEQLSLTISGDIDTQLFYLAWNFVIRTNEMLRTVFHWENVKDPVQIVLKKFNLKPTYINLSDSEIREKEKLLQEIKITDRKNKFDLREVPFRVTLCKIQKCQYEMIISNHHILYDGWSNGIILGEFLDAYNNLIMGNPLKPQLKTKFKEFVKGMKKQDLKKQEKYWTDYLKDLTLSTGLSLKNMIKDRNPDKMSGTYSNSISSPIKDSLHRFVKEVNITPASLLYSALGILLQRYNNCDDVLLGTTVSGRSAKIKGIENMVGLFINTLPLRIQTLPNEKAIDLIYRIQEVLAQREEYERTSLVDIRKYYELGTGNRGELFDVIVAVENYPLLTSSRINRPDMQLSIVSYQISEMTEYDLTVLITITEEIKVNFIYNADLLTIDSMERLGIHFSHLLEKIVKNSHSEINEIDVLSDEETARILFEFNRTDTDYPGDKTIQQLFEEQVERIPDHMAIIGQIPNSKFQIPNKNVSITYKEFNQNANQLAHQLIEKGIRTDTIVGIMIERSIEMMIGIFGILKAGSAYLPIDPNYPQERICYMMADTRAKLLVTTRSLAKEGDKIIRYEGKKNFEIVFLDFSTLPSSHLHPSPAAVTSLAYIIYTSGTTGKPKGVMINHDALVNRLNWMQNKYLLDENDTILHKTPFTFDVSVWEILWWSIVGARVCLLVPAGEKDPGTIVDTVARNRVTVMHFVPSMLTLFLEYLKRTGGQKRLEYLRQVVASGEVLIASQVNAFKEILYNEHSTGLANLYGPTEATIDVSYYNCFENNDFDVIPIGKPIDNIQLYILDKRFYLQPIGIAGELCIAGVGLARGYLNRLELTAEKFIGQVTCTGDRCKCEENKKKFFTDVSWSRGRFLQREPPGLRRQKLYRTGDLARWLQDGNIEFLGRIDHQLKIRGFRIEPGEIEHQLVNFQGIDDAVVIAKESPGKSNYLCAFIVSEHEFNLSELRRYLYTSLPDYMIPGEFIRLEKIPVNSNGKVDRKALQSNRLPGTRLDTTVSYTAPGSEMEKIIADTWKEVLQREKVGIHDNFFDIGGNSFSIIRLNSRLKEAFKKDIPITDLFNYPTVASLAHHLSGGEKQGENHFDHIETREVKEFVVGRKEIAVIGMSGRFPGAKNIDEFWENLKNGVESIRFFSDNEVELSGTAADHKNNPDYVKAKGMLEGIEFFDASFFEYTRSQAELMDPQTRIFHECCWNALENAGYDPHAYKELIGLYAGATPNLGWEAQSLLIGLDAAHFLEQWEALQFRDKDYLSTRVSYKLNLKGPAVTMQTACSTSLAAIDMACQGLLTARCDIALAGGVSITLHDQTGYPYQEGMIMSRDGHCRTFDERATGTVNGNGAAVVVLKPLKEAEADRDFIYAVIKGSAVNNDGTRKVGFSAPSIEGQAEAIRAALRMAAVEAESISYLETHGTGTILGDPIEMEALKLAFHSNKKCFCGIGSVKTNIGHLDAAAGVAGFIKTALALKHRLIPPSLHFNSPNPKMNIENSPFYVNTTLKEWKNNEYPLRAGISSFGIGGTNVHVILEEAPTKTRDNEGTRGLAPLINAETSKEYQIILLSAKSESVLEKMTGKLVQHFKNNPGINLDDAAYTLQVGRKAMAYRSMLVCSNPEEVTEKIQSGEKETGRAKEEKSTVIFMFSGQGSQYVNMGLDLYQQYPVFRHQVDCCFELLEKITGKNIKPILYPGLHATNREINKAEEKIYQFLYTTPIKFIFEYSLATLLMKWGIQPDAMIGHSFGEYVCACISGVFSLEDGLFLSALRGELMHGLPEGAMLSVPLAEEDLKPLLPDELSLAAVNGPSLCVVSGPVTAIEQFEAKLNEKGYECLRYRVPKAGHSRMVEPIMAEFREKIAAVRFQKPKIPYISGMTGTWSTAEQAVDPEYWTQHLRQPVRFADGLTTLFKELDPVFIQVGPGRGLTLFVQLHADKKPGTPALNLVKHRKEKVSDEYYILNKIGQLWLYGVSIDWQRFYPGRDQYRIPLPTYPFESKYYNPQKDLFKIDAARSSAKPLLVHKTDMSDWFYIPLWEQSPLTSSAANKSQEAQKSFNWLVFMDDLGLGTQLVKALRNIAREVVTVKLGEEYSVEGENSYFLNPRQAGDYDRLFHKLREPGMLPDKIIHLWGVTDNQKREGGLKELDWIQELGFFSLLYMVQALGRENISREMQIKAITNNMQSVTGEEDTCPEKATIRGAVRIIPLEYTNLRCTSIDILIPCPGSQIPDTLVQQLLEELMVDSSSLDSIIALRGNRRWCETMKPCRLERIEPVGKRLKEKGIYLITGGFGGMGFTIAQHLAKNFRAKLILVGRSFFPQREEWSQWLDDHPQDDKLSTRIRKIKELEELGAEIMVFSVDVSHEKQMRAVIAEAHQRFGPINGVLHTAGIGDYAGLIQQRTREMNEEIMAPKIKGSLVLDQVLKDDRLDFQVLFSSIGNVIYQVKFAQVAYNAANEFLEAFAYYKTRKDGTYTVTINWNDWLEVGMSIEATNRKYRKHWRYKTLGDSSEIDYESAVYGGITPAQGIEVFMRILDHTLERVTVSRIDLHDMIQALRSLKNKETDTIEAVELQATPRVVEQRPTLRIAYTAPINPLEEALCKTWSNYFGIEPVGTEDDFFELGGDSLKAMIITHKIHKELDVRIPLVDFFNNPNIKGLAEYIQRAEKKIHSTITPAEKKEYYALAFAQQRIFILHQMEKNSTSYNIIHTVLLEGEIDKRRLEGTFYRLLERHESLRTSFILVDHHPVQIVHKDVEFSIEYYDIPSSSSVISHRNISSEFIRPFDLNQAPLLRVGLIQLREPAHILMVDMHHIISDGTSIEILIKDFMALYANQELELLPIRYRDYSQWQMNRKEQESLRSQERFWIKEFEGEIPVLNVYTDYTRPVPKSFKGKSLDFEISAEASGALRLMALEEGATLFMVLLAIIKILLSKLSGQEDIVVGTPIAGREHESLKQMVGMFVNTLALRNYPVRNKTFLEFLYQLKEKNLAAFENQEYPFEELVEKVEITRDNSRNPLFDVMFVFQNMEPPVIEIPGLNLKPIPFETGTSQFDLSFNSHESNENENIFFSINYCTELFTEKTIKSYCRYFNRIIVSILEDRSKRIGEIEMIPGDEKEKILQEFNHTSVDYPRDKTLHQLFRQQVEKTPDHIAVIGEMQSAERRAQSIERDKERHGPWAMRCALTYRELNEKSDRLAYLLKEKGVGFDTIVCIMVERSLQMVIGILGILKAGGAYLPIDPDYPKDRINYILADSGAKVLMAASETRVKVKADVGESFGQPPQRHLKFIDMETELASTFFDPPHSTLTSTFQVSPANLAYVIYTSGSTGVPKGVIVEHRSAVNVLTALQKRYPLKEADTYLLKTSYLFDVSVAELFGWFFAGGRLAILEKNGEKDPGKIIDAIEQANITHINFVPSMFRLFVEELTPQNINKLSVLKYIFLAGEALLPEPVEKFKRLTGNTFNITLENIYGPTEGTIYSCWYSLAHWQKNTSIPIGKPLPNIRLYILDQYGSLQPTGVPGELCIAGDGLVRGYLNNSELTDEKFNHDLWDCLDYHDKQNKSFSRGVQKLHGAFFSKSAPLAAIGKLYKTGDLARWFPDGNIEFLGRIDRQVKIRGFRVELGEIESRLLNVSGVKEAVVLVREEVKGDKYICAYFVSDRTYGMLELRESLSKELPDYMIPSYFMEVKQIPLTPNGKIDRKALPALEIEAGKEYIAPRNEMETKIAGIWSEVLGREKKVISIDSNFFQSGGHSLKAAIMALKIHKELKVELPLVEIFKTPTIRGLSKYIGQLENVNHAEIEPVEKREYYPLSSAQKRLYIVHQMKKDNIVYNSPGMMILEGELRVKWFEETNRRLIDRHESLRTSFHMMDDTPVQRIHDQVEFEIEYYDSVNMQKGISNKEELLVEPIIKKFILAFDLSQAPLLRVGLIKVEPQKHILMVDMHHIITDGTSQEIFTQEFMALYGEQNLSPLKIQYKDYSEWRDRPEQKELMKQQESYWLNLFSGELPTLNLPTDYPRSDEYNHEGDIIFFTLKEKLGRGLKELAEKEKTTLFTILLTNIYILFSKICRQRDLVIGTPVAGRRHLDIYHVIGFFVNTLALRNFPTADKTFTEFLYEVRDRAIEAFENQDYPFEELANQLGTEKSAGRNPVFDVIFAFQNIEVLQDHLPEIEISDLIIKPYMHKRKTSPFDLVILAYETGDTLTFNFLYRIKLFKKGTINRLIKYFEEIITSVLENQHTTLRDIKISPGLLDQKLAIPQIDFSF